jgi:hypothetical protein
VEMINPVDLVRVRCLVDPARVCCLELTSVEIPVLIWSETHWARVKVGPEPSVMTWVSMTTPEGV